MAGTNGNGYREIPIGDLPNFFRQRNGTPPDLWCTHNGRYGDLYMNGRVYHAHPNEPGHTTDVQVGDELHMRLGGHWRNFKVVE